MREGQCSEFVGEGQCTVFLLSLTRAFQMELMACWILGLGSNWYL